jgi:hypothetical protein
MDEIKAERKRMRYVRRHQEAAHDAASWLMMCLLWARWSHLEKGPEMPIPPDIPLSFQGPKARRLFRRAGAITPDDIGSLPPEYAAVCHILQARAAREQFAQLDIDRLTETLNYPVCLRACDRRIEQDKDHARMAAELLITYLDSLVWSHVPQAIGVCQSCKGLFLRIKANQSVCSDYCRYGSLSQSGYWSTEERKKRRKRRIRAENRKRKR